MKADWEDSQGSWDDATCSAVASADAVDCQALLIAMGNRAAAISLTLQGLSERAVPSEMADLLSETAAAARTADDAGGAVECPGDQCVSTAFTFERAWDNLGGVLTEWEPYL